MGYRSKMDLGAYLRIHMGIPWIELPRVWSRQGAMQPVAVSVRRQAGTRLGQVIGEYIHMINYWPTVVTFWQQGKNWKQRQPKICWTIPVRETMGGHIVLTVGILQFLSKCDQHWYCLWTFRPREVRVNIWSHTQTHMPQAVELRQVDILVVNGVCLRAYMRLHSN